MSDDVREETMGDGDAPERGSRPDAEEDEPHSGDPVSEARRWRTPLVLIALTFAATFYTGALMHSDADPFTRPLDVLRGWDFALPLMAILLSHELGHYIAGKIHRVDISPPYFIPMPFLSMLGTMGAVIRMRGAIRDRNALLDVGAAGPLAGMAVALPVLVVGIATSPVAPLPTSGSFIAEGHSLLYVGLLWLLKGPIPEGMDIMLSPTAFAGWAGLLVTMINLLPVAQLDGGHVAYALLGERQNRIARRLVALLPVIAVVTSAFYLVPAFLGGDPEWWEQAFAGVHWLVWFGVLLVMARFAGMDHPPAGGGPLTPTRKVVAIGTLVLFVLLFMPSWAREG